MTSQSIHYSEIYSPSPDSSYEMPSAMRRKTTTNKLKRTRCHNGSRKNKKTGKCDPKNTNKSTRCAIGTHRNKKTGKCDPKNTSPSITLRERCRNGFRKNKKSGRCETKYI
jgi:hypothetical protein